MGLQSSIDHDCCDCTLCWYHDITFLAQQALRMDIFTQDAAIWMSECTYKIEEGQVSLHYTLVLFERWRNFHSCQRLYSHLHQNQKLISICIEFLAKLQKAGLGNDSRFQSFLLKNFQLERYPAIAPTATAGHDEAWKALDSNQLIMRFGRDHVLASDLFWVPSFSVRL